MISSTPSSYDLIPFQGKPAPERAPDTFHVFALLFGLTPPPVDSFSLVELGCGAGSALLPLAVMYPEATFVGIDSAAGQIERGQDLVDELKLTNVELRSQEIEDMQASAEQFDYLICHGVLSWVPAEVRTTIFSLCQTLLKRNGLCYLSYNTLPGWATRGEVRERLIEHVDSSKLQYEQVQDARRLLESWEFDLRQKFSNEAMKLKEELRVCIQQSDAFILHELLAPLSKPFFLSEFLRIAEKNDLQFLAEGLPSRMYFSLMLDDADFDRVEAEQELDHHSNVSFRGTILCKKEMTTSVLPESGSIDTLYISSSLVPKVDVPDIHSSSVQTFVAPDDIEFNEQVPIVKAALIYLRGLWPEPVPFQEVYEAAHGLVSSDEASAEEGQLLKEALLRLFFKNVVFFNVGSGNICRKVSKYPRVSPVAIAQARSSWWVTTLRNEYLYIDQFQRHLIQYLDGDHDVNSLGDKMMLLVEQGLLTPKEEGQEIVNSIQIRAVVIDSINAALTAFAESALLLK